MLLGLVAQVLADEPSPTTHGAVWADFDPRKEPLEITALPLSKEPTCSAGWTPISSTESRSRLLPSPRFDSARMAFPF
jgi:hypothetical protein